MHLHECPLVMEAFLQIKLDGGGWHGGKRGGWFINRWAVVPPEWEEELIHAELLLSRFTGLYVKDVLGPDHKYWQEEYVDAEPTNSLLGIAIMGDDVLMPYLLERLEIPTEAYEKAQVLFNDFFDGDEQSRHERMQELFVTDKYEY